MNRVQIPQLMPDMPCVCDSGKPLRECCAVPGGGVAKALPRIEPPRPRSGYSHPRCYLRSTKDCSEKITGEHFISRTVLEVLGDMVAIDGAPWLPAGERREIGINSLTAKVLCDRHNGPLSPLDRSAGELFGRLLGIHRDMRRSSLSRKGSIWLTSGEALERWMLKAACGFFYSKNASKEAAALATDHVIDDALVVRALFSGVWNHGCGLYMRAGAGMTFTTAGAVSISALTSSSEKRVVGARLIMGGLWFDLLFDNSAFDEEWYQSGWVYRPAELIFENGRRLHRIWLSWPMPGTGYSLTLSYKGSPALLKKGGRR